MGYCMSAKDDERLTGDVSVEIRRESAVVSLRGIVASGEHVEIPYRDIPRLIELLEIAQDYNRQLDRFVREA